MAGGGRASLGPRPNGERLLVEYSTSKVGRGVNAVA